MKNLLSFTASFVLGLLILGDLYESIIVGIVLLLLHCCPKRFSSITNFVDFTDLNRCKSAFLNFNPSFT
jgi:hypothetical protein